MTRLLLPLTLALAVTAHAAPPRWIASVVAVMAGGVLDVASSRGRFERNPLARNASGQCNVGRLATLKAGALGGTLALQWVYARHHREAYRPLAWANGAIAGGLVGVAAHNWRVKP